MKYFSGMLSLKDREFVDLYPIECEWTIKPMKLGKRENEPSATLGDDDGLGEEDAPPGEN